MRIGLHITKFDWPGGTPALKPTLTQIARTADQAGFYSLWVMDHYFQLGERFGPPHGAEELNMLEAYSTLSFMAGLTHNVKLGALVSCNLFRHPGALVKVVTTLDVLSGGRAYFGLGAGWFEREADCLGFPLPGTWKERFDRLEETLQIAHKMLSDDRTPYDGKYYQLSEPINHPLPLSQPRIPILIGGEGEKRTLRLVAQYADACNFVVGSPVEDLPDGLRISYEDGLDFLRHKLNVLHDHCRELGRPYDEIEKTMVTYIRLRQDAQKPVEIIDWCGKLAQAGFEHVIFILLNLEEITPLEVFGTEIIPAVRDM
jgi:F420-dependent oxidoreductase-like protein